MSVTDIPTRKKYDCDGAVKAYPIPFKYLANSHVTVKHIDSVGVVTTLILDDVGADGFTIVSGEVVTNTLYPATDEIWLVRDTPHTQSTVRKDNRRTAASVDDGSYDKSMMVIQEIDDILDRSLLLTDTTPTDVSTELPAPVARRAIMVDATGKNFIYSTNDPDLAGDAATEAAASAAAALVSETAAGVSETNAGVSEGNASDSADEAAGYAAGLNMPAIQPGDAYKVLKVNSTEDGWVATANQRISLQSSDGTPILDNGTDGTDAAFAGFCNLLKQKIIEIGVWDMDATSGISVAHGLTHSKIRSVSAAVRNDADDKLYPLTPGISNSVGDGSVLITSGGNVALLRLTGGFYDSTDFDLTAGPYNRGWIVIDYVE